MVLIVAKLLSKEVKECPINPIKKTCLHNQKDKSMIVHDHQE